MLEAKKHQSEVQAVALGTENQKERYAAGLLPDDELAQLARDELFEPFRTYPLTRWSTNRDRERMEKMFRHTTDCSIPDMEFETAITDDMTADEWSTFKRINAAASMAQKHDWLDSGAIKVEPFTHFLTCKACGAELSRISVKITIHWAGRDLVREYALSKST